MSKKRLVTQNPIHYRYLNNYLDIQTYKLSMISFNKPPSTIKKQLNKIQKSRSTSSLLERSIKQQNFRLVTKIMQISNRKIKKYNKDDNFIVNGNKMNPQRQKSRDIMLQNQRLGRTLIKIKTGKSVQKIKTEMDQNIKKKGSCMIKSNRSDKISNTSNKKLFKQQKSSKIIQPSYKMKTNQFNNYNKTQLSHVFIHFPQNNTKTGIISDFLKSRK